jgi:hypothetical protein
MRFAARQRSPLSTPRPMSARPLPAARVGLQYRLVDQAPFGSWVIARHRFALHRMLRAAREVFAFSFLLVFGREGLACSL